jgi:hypothetical protein
MQLLKDDDVRQAAAAVRFGVRFAVDISVNFNQFFHQNPRCLASLSPPATIASCQALEHVVVWEDVLEDDYMGFLGIYKAFRSFSQRWKVGGKCFIYLFSLPLYLYLLGLVLEADTFRLETTLNGMSQCKNLNEWVANADNNF